MNTDAKSDKYLAILFMAPFLILMFVFMICVFVNGFLTSLTDAQGIDPGTYVGLSNFKSILKDSSFWKSIFVTFKLTVISVFLQIPFSFFLALWIETVPFGKMRSIIKAFFFVPALINTIVAGVLFRYLFSGERCMMNLLLEPVNALFNHLFNIQTDVLLSGLNWLEDGDLAFSLVVITYFWQCVGFQAIYFSAYHGAIEKSVYEAAKIDGASNFTIMSKITLPLMRPALTFMAVTSAVSSLMLYDLIMSLFPYGAHENAKTIIYYIYERSFGWKLELGAASAAGWITFLIILSVSLLQLKFFGPGSHDDA